MRKVFDKEVKKYAGEGNYVFPEEELQKVIVIGIIMEKITGKKSGVF